ncbi:MAG: glycosyltransferase family 4 protein [Nitrospirae bacterium]|jgi:glycosyltransferase involved in cell wall biosynthesis|nr:glycosyltransferase family 4 protein [Nitrospirota bacterium]
MPWQAKKVLHHLLFPSYVEIIEEDLPSRPILFIAPNLPYPDRGGTDFRLFHLLKGTIKAGYPISFFSIYERDLLAARLGTPDLFLQYEHAMRQLPLFHLFYGIRAFRKFLKNNPEAFSAIFILWPKSVQAVIPTIKRYGPSIPVIYDMVDYHARRLKREGKLHSDPRILAKAKEFRIIESEAARSTNLTLAISREEKELFLADNPATNIDVLGNYFEPVTDPVPDPERRAGLLFVGNFVHAPNTDGILWFVRDIYPLVKQECPSVPLHIVGDFPPPEIQSLSEDPDIVVHGWVPDLSELFRSSRVFVASLRYGAGVKGKVGLAMSKGLPVVTTAIGAEGMNLTSGVDCEIVDSPEGFARKTILLLSDDDHWSRISIQGQQYANKNSSTDALPDKMRQIFESIGVSPPHIPSISAPS